MNLLSILLKTLLADKAVSALGKKTGLSASSLKKLIPLALPLLLKYLTSNASSQSGALSLLGALGQHTSQKTVADQIAEADETDGGKILGHILGQESDAEIRELAKKTGLSTADVNKVLGNMTPALLSSLNTAAGSAKKKVDLSDGLDLSDVMGLLGGAAPSGGLLSGLKGLLGGKKEEKEEKDDALNGNALMQTLLTLMK